MMGRRLAVNVALRNPDTGLVETFTAGTVPPGWALDEIGDHAYPAPEHEPDAPSATEDDRDDDESVDDERPKKNASREAWAEYADAHDIAYPEDADRAEIIAAVEALYD